MLRERGRLRLVEFKYYWIEVQPLELVLELSDMNTCLSE